MMVSAMEAIHWDLRNPQAILKGRFATPKGSPVPKWLVDFQHGDKL
jgi:hypothetical protein